MNEFEELRRYKELLDQEVITQEEFERIKEDILERSGSSISISSTKNEKQVSNTGLKTEPKSDSNVSVDSSEIIAQKRIEEEKKIADEMAARRAAEEKKLAEEVAAKRAAEEKRLAEEVAARKRAEEERKFAEEMAKKRAEEEAKIAEEIEKRRKEEEAKIAEEMAKKRAAEENTLLSEISMKDDESVALDTETQSASSDGHAETTSLSEIESNNSNKDSSVRKRNVSKKPIIIVAVILCVAIVAAIAFLGGNSSRQEETASTDTDTSEETATESQTKDITYKDADILTFELVNTDNESYEESILTYKVTNNGSNAIDNISNMSFSYRDKDGNEICTDGRYQPCKVQPGKSAFVKSYSDLGDDYSKDDIGSVEVTSYSYVIDKVEYSVDLQTKTVDSYKDDYTEYIDFEKANILGFECNGKGLDSINSYEVDVKVINNSDADADEVSYYLVYSNDNGDCLCNDGRFLENVLAAGKSANGTSFCDEEFSKDVSSFEVYSYEYKSMDSNSEFDSIVVNLQTKTAIGYKN